MQNYIEIALKLFLAAILGGLIGFEREAHGRAAGLRTHILVSVGSCLIMLTSIHIFNMHKSFTTCDPARIAAGVVTGIGFLGAGTILRYRGSVMGLTTAASIWAVAAVGLATGSGFYYGGLLTTILVLITLVLVSKLEYSMIRKDWYKTLIIESEVHGSRLQEIRDALSGYKVQIKDLEIEKIPDKKESILKFDIKLTTNKEDDNIVVALSGIEGVSRVRWE
ncbi:MAG: MgtC/SapB family protein [Candidatus Omnitrophica bacterium]|nr:MgtC/SapB family protein [Candidatus Omnitrophota bacterium]